jgi:molecular chaperone DnaK (HSP70)
VEHGHFKVLCVEGANDLGGRDFDNALFDVVRQKLGKRDGVDCASDPTCKQKVLIECEAMKIQLSTAQEAVYNFKKKFKIF